MILSAANEAREKTKTGNALALPVPESEDMLNTYFDNVNLLVSEKLPAVNL